MTFSILRTEAAMPSPARLVVALLAVFLLVAGIANTSAYAQSLDQAKAGGQIGEQPDGYLGIVGAAAPTAIRQMVEDVNLKRRERYRGIASKNGTNLQAVEALTGKKLVEEAPTGQYVRLPDGRWIRK
jgi:uncharacterized protein YdbL (DUF1318 family)